MTFHIIFPGNPANSIRVSDIDPKFANKLEKRQSAFAETGNPHPRKVEYRYNLYTEQKRSLLVIFQAPDAGGKDGLFILSVK